jgi:hypothetical protein
MLLVPTGAGAEIVELSSFGGFDSTSLRKAATGSLFSLSAGPS